MPKPAFFVQNNYVERLTIPVALHARKVGVELLDRSTNADFQPDNCGIDWSTYGPVLPYGSVQLARQLRESVALRQYMHYDAAAFTHAAWLEHSRSDMLNGGGRLMGAGAVAAALANGPLHARPEFVDKAFHAAVFDADSWADVVRSRALSPDLQVWVAQTQTLGSEWRCWIVGGEVVEVSKYRHAGARAVEQESGARVWAEAMAHAAGWLPARCVVMDLAETPQGIRKVEFNPIHCSGWYAADVGRVMDRWLEWSVANQSQMSPAAARRRPRP